MSGELIRVIVVIIIAAVLITAVRMRLPEYGFLITIAVMCVVFITVIGNLFGAISQLRELFNKSGNTGTYFVVALKALGISYITMFAADVCRDFGLTSFAQTAELCGKIAIFVLSLPLMSAVLDAAVKFVGL